MAIKYIVICLFTLVFYPHSFPLILLFLFPFVLVDILIKLSGEDKLSKWR